MLAVALLLTVLNQKQFNEAMNSGKSVIQLLSMSKQKELESIKPNKQKCSISNPSIGGTNLAILAQACGVGS